MTTSTEYDKFLAQHQALQAETGAATADRVARAQALMAEIVAAGAHIREARRRETLRSILRYWGAWVFEQTGEYPPSQMMPAVPDTLLPARPAWLGWAAAAGVAVLALWWAGQWLTGMAQAGPTPTALTGAAGETDDISTQNAVQTGAAAGTSLAALTDVAPASLTPTRRPTVSPSVTPTPSPTLRPSPTPVPTITRTSTPGPTPTPAFTVILRGHTDSVRALAFSPDGARLASGGLDATVRVWDLATQSQRSLFESDQWVFGLIFSANSSRLFVATGLGLQSGGRLAVLDVESNRLALRSDTLFIDNVSGLALDRFGTKLAAGSVGNAVDNPNVFLSVRQPDSLMLDASFSDNPVFAVAFSPDGSRLVYGGTDRALYVRDLSTSNNRRITMAARDRHAGFVRAVAFHPIDNTLAASASEDGTLRLWRVEADSLRLLATLQGGAVKLFALAFSPDGRQIAAAGVSEAGSSLVELWDVEAAVRGDAGLPFALDAAAADVGQTVPSQRALAFRALAYSPDGRLLAAAGDDTDLFIWTVR